MILKVFIFIIFNTFFVNGLPLNPKISLEKYRDVKPIETNHQMAIKFNLSGFYNEELIKLVESMENLCKKVKEKFEDEHPFCEDQIRYNQIFLNEIRSIWIYSNVGDLVDEDLKYDVKIKELNVLEFTDEMSIDLAKQILDISTYLNTSLSIIFKESSSLVRAAIDCTERLYVLSSKFGNLRSYVMNRFNDIFKVLEDPPKKELNSFLLNTGA